MKDKLDALKNILKLALKTKSVRVYKDGRIIVNFSYDPMQLPAKASLLHELQSRIQKAVRNITEIEYRITTTKIEPSSSHSTYEKVLENSTVSTAEVKRLMKYFVKKDKGPFYRSSYAKVTLILTPPSAAIFADSLMKS
jgi:hypothetical protein